MLSGRPASQIQSGQQPQPNKYTHNYYGSQKVRVLLSTTRGGRKSNQPRLTSCFAAAVVAVDFFVVTHYYIEIWTESY